MSLEGIKAWAGDVVTETVNGAVVLGHGAVNAGHWVVGEVVGGATAVFGVAQAVAANPAASALAVKDNAIALATHPFAYVAAHTTDAATHPFGFIFAFWAWLFVGLILGNYIGKIARKILGQGFFTRGFGKFVRWVLVVGGVGYAGYLLWFAFQTLVAPEVVGPFVLLFGTISLGIRLAEEPQVVELNAPAEVPAAVQAAVPAAAPVAADKPAETTEQK